MKALPAALGLCFALALALPRGAEAQKVYRIGALVADDQFAPSFEGFKRRMSDLGYVEGKTVRYTFFNAGGDVDKLKELAQEVVRERPDLIVTSSTTATVPVAKLTEGNKLPVVFLSAGNPLKFVKSYASSGNNVTGITSSIVDLTEKRLDLLKELAPVVRRVIFLYNPKGENFEDYRNSSREAAKRLGFALAEVELSATHAEEVEKRIFLITRKFGDGLLIPPDISVVSAVDKIAKQAIKEKLPSVGPNSQNVRRGVLAAYSPDYYALGRQGAALVDKILRGTKPTDLPIEQPSKLNLVINLKTAKAIGLKVHKEILLRADEVIE
jgi:putative ABC transport system substrate-binding protein